MHSFRGLAQPETDHLSPRMIVRHPVFNAELGLVKSTWMYTAVVEWSWGECYADPLSLEMVRPKPMVVRPVRKAGPVPQSHPDAI